MKISMKKLSCVIFLLAPLSVYSASAEEKRTESVGDLSQVRSIVIDRDLTEQGKKCVSCHKDTSPGIVSDWKDSRHAHVGVSCIDCHQVDKDSPMAVSHETIIDKDKYKIDKDMLDKDVFISVLVPPSVCGRCHADEQEEFNKSGHIRAYRQFIPKDSLHALVHQHEGQNNPELSNAPYETGCMQCHGAKIKLDKDGRPTPDTWPNAGMGNVYASDRGVPYLSRWEFGIGVSSDGSDVELWIDQTGLEAIGTNHLVMQIAINVLLSTIHLQ